MVVVQAKSRRKSTGSRYKSAIHKKVLAQIGSAASLTGLGKLKVEEKRQRGGHIKYSLAATTKVNIFDPAKKTYSVADIKTITDNPANKNFVRRNIMTKGSIIDTTAGKAKITSRPGQQKTINAVLVSSN